MGNGIVRTTSKYDTHVFLGLIDLQWLLRGRYNNKQWALFVETTPEPILGMRHNTENQTPGPPDRDKTIEHAVLDVGDESD